MKVKDLTGVPLDWAVSTALGHSPALDMKSHGSTWYGWWERTPLTVADQSYRKLPRYSTEWADAGPIIEREGVCILSCWSSGERRTSEHDAWVSYIPFIARELSIPRTTSYGPTPLVAAMRCYVVSRLGEEIEIPTGLI